MSDTKSEAASAIVVVRANGRKSSPVTPPTRASGKNTAMVVTVEAVMAVAVVHLDEAVAVVERVEAMKERARPRRIKQLLMPSSNHSSHRLYHAVSSP